jgi:hypothetical protein
LEENKVFKKLKDKKGFTLVELIVVLVILAILAALLIPALTGYIDKANAEKTISQTRMVVMAAQTEASSCYGKGPLSDGTGGATKNMPTNANIIKLAEIKALGTAGTDDAVTGGTAYYTIHVNTAGEVLDVAFNDGTFVCLYKDGQYTVGKKTDNTALAASSSTISIATSVTGNAIVNPIA